MPTANQRHRSANHRGQSGGQGKDNLQQKVQDTAEQAKDKLSSMRDHMADYAESGRHQLNEMTRGHEGQAVFAALAAGFGIGLVIGISLASGSRRPATWRERLSSEGYGKRLMEHVDSMLPEMISKHLHG